MRKVLVKNFLVIAASLPLLAGCVVYEQPGPPPPPPPPRVEFVPVAPGPVTVWAWVPGDWQWRGGRWVWVGGRWTTRPRRGAVWVPAHWEHRGHHNGVWVEGYWR